jgi:DNA-binding MarR family transcriptional regulator
MMKRTGITSSRIAGEGHATMSGEIRTTRTRDVMSAQKRGIEPSGQGETVGTVDPLALERQVCFALVVASRSVLSVYRPLLDPLGLTHPQYLVMLALWGESPLSVGQIGALLQLDSPTLSPLLKRLESAGMITRTRSGHDERQVDVALTERGRDLRSEAEKIPPAIVAQLGMSIPELEDLHAALSKVIAAARNAGPPPV